MSLTSDFLGDPKEFLKTKVVIVPEATDHAVGAPSVRHFKLMPHGSNSVLLVVQDEPRGEHIRAYYLKWAMGQATTMDLGSKADFFFTSEMTNCRFSILADDPKKPKVAHVAGNTKTSDRNEWEKQSGFVDDGSKGRARRLSVSQGYDPQGRGKPKEHLYIGQRFGQSSAFVFGHRTNGDWKFYAQVVKGNMSAPSEIDLSSDLTILKYPKTNEVLMEL
jgi:hypothetical protein